MTTTRSHNLDASIFRTYDIRGIVDESLTTETVFAIGQALGTLVQQQGGKGEQTIPQEENKQIK